MLADRWELKRKIIDVIIELEDARELSIKMYPSELAERIVLAIQNAYSVYGWVHSDPIHYFPGWGIYKTIANGFSWKGRKRRD